jgi:hypothetical protein
MDFHPQQRHLDPARTEAGRHRRCRSDILWIDNAGNVAIWFMNGAPISSTAGLGNVGTNWAVQAQNAE